MKLLIADRINLSNILPEKGNAVNMKLLRDLKGELSFSEQEIKKYKIKAEQVENEIQYNWKSEFDTEKEIKIGATLNVLIVDIFKDLDAKEEITDSLLNLYGKFMEK